MTTAVGMPCPICRVPLVMSERQGVEIDYCPQCRGVWLDRGELDKILERSAADSGAMAPPPPPRQPNWQASPASPWPTQQHSGYHGGQGKPHKRRKSFLEELFD
ncbi:zf-TFIIB domain-containing protein [Sphingomonas sp. PL-96]|uniref:TFIIB-type zinc ribbon-containing protein n=1 Tax=Sphingomonas sp. PL-96 TaxID=2887201 RepID=UPI001E35D211|nr:zf-TFIIB domain-containing protein [Sphingomonas sp. PL-96]MCC2975958.1 zf-TFIIB domain-containing protein [Sphingomonas sp. PL-96]